jgi:choline dehydrogenase-like flavoprotein
VGADVFVDARSVQRDTVVDTDVCIIGGGAAGITLARELRDARLSVTLLESGGFSYEIKTQDLYRGRNTGIPYFALDGVRLRYFGGTTNHWGGFCRPFDDKDFEPREGIPFTGWPIRRADLAPYYGRASTICGLPSGDWKAAAADARRAPIQLDPRRFDNRVVRIVPPPVSFGTRYRESLQRARTVTAYLHANVVGMDTDESGRRVTLARVATLSGNRFSVRARVFVLAAGGLENPRLLLASNHQWPRGLGNQHDVVGRFFLEHPRFLAAYLVPTERQPNPRAYAVHRVRGEDEQAYLASSKQFQIDEGLLDLQLSLTQVYNVPHDVSEYAGYVFDVANGLSGWERVAVPGAPLPIPYPEVLSKAISQPKDTYNAVRGKVDKIAVTSRIEPAPNPDSRVTLIRARDELGMHRIALNWQLSRIDKHNLARTLSVFGAEVGRSQIGRLKILHREDEAGWPSDIAGGWHLMGTTRMSDDPKTGVVDRDGRVHGISNMYIAGSSIFPTAGGATPTLTLVALTLRLADHLKAAGVR